MSMPATRSASPRRSRVDPHTCAVLVPAAMSVLAGSDCSIVGDESRRVRLLTCAALFAHHRSIPVTSQSRDRERLSKNLARNFAHKDL